MNFLSRLQHHRIAMLLPYSISRDWARQLNWLNTTFSLILPMIGAILAFWTPLTTKTFTFAWIYALNTGIGITAGYHRLWSHRSYRACRLLKIYLAAVGAGAIQGSIRWWSREHRAHHRYTDTDKDPYSVKRGLFYSHLGWVIFKRDPSTKGRADIRDLDSDPIVVLQHRYYYAIAVVMGFVIPILVCGLGWQDWAGGVVYAGILRMFYSQQVTFCVNSVAHWLGEQPFSSNASPRDHFLTAVLTMGEGYHNFHHEFPSDYRNGIRWYQFDPTKWFIATCNHLGLASHLQRFPSNEIEKGRLQEVQKQTDQKRSSLNWGTPLHQLPAYEWHEFVEEARHRPLLLISGVIYDTQRFVNSHPGGKIMLYYVGKDASAAFNGGVYSHSNAAHNLLSTLRFATLRGGCEVKEAQKNIM